MATHYHCSNCRLTFPLDELHEQMYYVTSEFGGLRTMTASKCLVCPECGDDVDEATAPTAEEDEACCANEERDSTSNCINCGYPYNEV